MIKVMVIFGTRPEAIKMCPVIAELERSDSIETVVCVTGQHREMLQQVLEIFDVAPKYNLEIMKPGQTLAEITISVLESIQNVLDEELPDLVLVHGDTTTAFVSALASFYRRIPVGHVEAGLRTYNVYSPFPEEYNRQSIDLISTFLFVPTEDAKENLLKENKTEKKIYVTGNTVIDALHTTVKHSYRHEFLEWANGSRLLLVTAHRRENLGHAMSSMFRAIRRIVDDNDDVKVIFPVHLNPRVREKAAGLLVGNDRIRLIEPLSVVDFHNFMARSFLILTDSGGIQEEAAFLRKPVLVMRDTTERPEGIRTGTLKLVGTDEDAIYSECRKLLHDKAEYQKMENGENPYGDGKAAERIVRIILNEIHQTDEHRERE